MTQVRDPIFEKALFRLIGIEGDVANHPFDRGGETRYGVTKRLARAYGYDGSMDEMPFSLASEIYQLEFWEPLRCFEIAKNGGDALAFEIFEAAVNVGTRRSARWLQRALCLLNRRGEDYADISQDGVIGRKTLGALRALIAVRGGQGTLVLSRIHNAFQAMHYVNLAEADYTQEAFMYGWVSKRVA